MKLPMLYLLTVLFLPNTIAEYSCSKEWYSDYEIPNADCITPTNKVNLTERRKETPLKIVDRSYADDYFHAFHRNILYCCFLSQPYCPKIRWFKDGEELNSTYRGVHNFKMENGGSVLEVKAYHDSGGNYTCRATTPYDEVDNYTMKIEVRYPCKSKFHVNQIPKATNAIEVLRGANQTLKCEYYCSGNPKQWALNTWRNGKNEILRGPNFIQYLKRRKPGDDANGPDIEHTLTVLNFTKSENISCVVAQNPDDKIKILKNTFHLVLTVYAIPTPVTPEESFFKRTGQWIIIGILLVMLVILSMLVFWFRRRIKKWFPIFGYGLISKPDPNARYDAFVSYNENGGGSFVRSTLVPMLEEQCGYSLSLHYREFVPGEPIVDNIVKFLNTSRKILMVVTPEFLKSQWCMFEVHQGLHRAVFKPNTLVVIMLNEIPHSELPVSLVRFLNKTTYLVWDESKLNKMCSILKRTLGSPLKVKSQSNHGSPEESFGARVEM